MCVCVCVCVCVCLCIHYTHTHTHTHTTGGRGTAGSPRRWGASHVCPSEHVVALLCPSISWCFCFHFILVLLPQLKPPCYMAAYREIVWRGGQSICYFRIQILIPNQKIQIQILIQNPQTQTLLYNYMHMNKYQNCENNMSKWKINLIGSAGVSGTSWKVWNRGCPSRAYHV